MRWEWGIETLATLVECLGALYFIQDVGETGKQRRNLLLAIPLTAIIIWINRVQLVSLGPVLVYLLYFVIVSRILYRNRRQDVVWLASIYLLLVMVCDYVTAVWMETVTGRGGFVDTLGVIHFDSRWCYLLIDKAALILVAVLFKNNLQQYVVRTKYKFIITLGILGLVLVYITYNFKNVYAFMGWGAYVLICFAVAIVFIYYKRWKDAESAALVLHEKVHSYITYYEELCRKQEEKERAVHDINYHLLTLSQLLEQEEYQDCSQYLEKILGDFKNAPIKTFTGNRALDFIVNYKIDTAEKQGIKVVIDMDAVGNTASLEPSDVHIIFGNLLDNAIEACMHLKEEERWIEIKVNKVKRILFITIRNPYQEKPNMVNGVLVSGKENPDMHGIGLKSVEHCVEKYEGLFEIKFDAQICSAEAMIFI